VEIKHKGESKFQHPEPLACRKPFHATLYLENRWAATTTAIATTTRQRNKPPVNKHSKKPPPKQDSW
jgi:hypothetical protein